MNEVEPIEQTSGPQAPKSSFWTWNKIKYAVYALVIIAAGVVAYLESKETERYFADPQVGDIVYYVHDKTSETPIAAFKIIKVSDKVIIHIHGAYQYNTVSFAQKSIEKKDPNVVFKKENTGVMTREEFDALKVEHITRP